MKKNIFIHCIICLFFISCKKETSVFEQSPSERNRLSINNLRNELINAPYGWRVLYFSKTDSLLFSNKDEIIENIFNYEGLYGYGGHYFQMKFNAEGSVEILADFDRNSVENAKKSEFEVKQGTSTQLSFTTFTHLHKLINEKWGGSADFLFVRRDFHNNLVFKTASYDAPAREYIVFEQLKSQNAWENDIKKSYENRVFFESMQNPQLLIRQGSKAFFRSDVEIRKNAYRATDSYKKFLKEMIEKRYYLFRMALSREPVYNSVVSSSGLGSGYVGTEEGIRFNAGIRYATNTIFYDFQRVGDKFICELVRIYDPIFKEYLYVSKHRYPNGEPTYFVAEIFNEM